MADDKKIKYSVTGQPYLTAKATPGGVFDYGINFVRPDTSAEFQLPTDLVRDADVITDPSLIPEDAEEVLAIRVLDADGNAVFLRIPEGGQETTTTPPAPGFFSFGIVGTGEPLTGQNSAPERSSAYQVEWVFNIPVGNPWGFPLASTDRALVSGTNFAEQTITPTVESQDPNDANAYQTLKFSYALPGDSIDTYTFTLQGGGLSSFTEKGTQTPYAGAAFEFAAQTFSVTGEDTSDIAFTSSIVPTTSVEGTGDQDVTFTLALPSDSPWEFGANAVGVTVTSGVGTPAIATMANSADNRSVEFMTTIDTVLAAQASETFQWTYDVINVTRTDTGNSTPVPAGTSGKTGTVSTVVTPVAAPSMSMVADMTTITAGTQTTVTYTATLNPNGGGWVFPATIVDTHTTPSTTWTRVSDTVATISAGLNLTDGQSFVEALDVDVVNTDIAITRTVEVTASATVTGVAPSLNMYWGYTNDYTSALNAGFTAYDFTTLPTEAVIKALEHSMPYTGAAVPEFDSDYLDYTTADGTAALDSGAFILAVPTDLLGSQKLYIYNTATGNIDNEQLEYPAGIYGKTSQMVDGVAYTLYVYNSQFVYGGGVANEDTERWGIY